MGWRRAQGAETFLFDARMSDSGQSPSANVVGLDARLIRYGSLFLLIVGTFGNIVSFIIFSHGTLRKSSTFRYLALVSLMDLLVLYSGLLDLFLMIEYGNGFSLRILNPVSCRLHTFITYWSQHSSSWILSFISVDRAIATNCLKFAKKFCTPRSAQQVVGVILLLTALLNCHELIFLHLQYPSGEPATPDNFSAAAPPAVDDRRLMAQRHIQSVPTSVLGARSRRDLSTANLTTHMPPVKSRMADRKCEALIGSNYEFFWDQVWEWIDVCMYALIPFTVMSIGTFLIVYRVYYQQRRFFRSRRSGAGNPSGAPTNKAKSLFYLLFTLNLLYFILVSPVVFVTTILFRDQSDEQAYPRFKAIIYLMQYCNHSLNFIFYGITSPPYRRTLCEWFQTLFPHLPQCCQRTIRERTKSMRFETVRLKQMNITENKFNRLESLRSPHLTAGEQPMRKPSASLIPR